MAQNERAAHAAAKPRGRRVGAVPSCAQGQHDRDDELEQDRTRGVDERDKRDARDDDGDDLDDRPRRNRHRQRRLLGTR